MQAQLMLYKSFWSEKMELRSRDIACGFVLLKRGAKPGKVCELVPVSVGPKTLTRGIKIMK